jgi:hypothetical protein
MFQALYHNLTKLKSEQLTTLIDVLSQSLGTAPLSDEKPDFKIPITLIDLYTIGRFDRTYDRAETGPLSERPENSIFWYGSYHSLHYSKYMKAMYPDAKITTFMPETTKGWPQVEKMDFVPKLNRKEMEGCINLGNDNLDNFFK